MNITDLVSPWGAIDHVEHVAPGIVFVSTASHGGYYLTADHNVKVPLTWRGASFNRQGIKGWYEEDCDWALVALTFPDLFPPAALLAAKQVFKSFFEAKLIAA